MNYQEAIEALRLEGGLEIEGNLDKLAKFFDGLDTAIKALKEIHEYEKTGLNPNQVSEMVCELSATKRILGHYQKLGALEEVRESVEKQKTKKIEVWNGQAQCPCCRKNFGNMKDIKKLISWEMPYCKWCGQHIDWSE